MAKKRKDLANGEANGAEPPASEGKKKKKNKQQSEQKSVRDVNLGSIVSDDEKGKPSHFSLVKGGQGVLFGCRVPKDYFICTGAGDTNEGGGMDPWETGSYDLALEEANIEDFNVVAYTSVIPAESTEVALDQVKDSFHHGSVLETIMAKMNGSQGDRITAGVGMMKVRRKSDGYVYGGWAAEYSGHATSVNAKEVLYGDLEAMFKRRFKTRNLDDHEMVDLKYVIKEHEVKNNFGTVLAAICFCSYIYPLASPTSGDAL